MADFSLFNSATIAGQIAETPKEGDFVTTYGGKVLTIKARLNTTDEERSRQVYAEINFPYSFRSESRTAFDKGGNLLLKGTLSSWIPEPKDDYKHRAFLSIKANGAIQKEVNAGAVLTTEKPVYRNEVLFSGVRVSSPFTEGEEFDTPDKVDGNIYYLANSERNSRRNIIPVLLEDTPDGFLNDNGTHTVWTIEGRLDSVTLNSEENHWTDVVRLKNDDSITASGAFKEVSSCTIPCSASEDQEDETSSSDDVPF